MHALIIFVVLAGATAGNPVKTGRLAAQQTASPQQQGQPQQPEPYAYRPGGRRDPFLTLVGTGDTRLPTKRGEGPAGLSVAEISVRGILQSHGGLIAMIQGTDKRTYVIHPGEKLLDGTIKSISPQGLTIVQDVTDPLSLLKQREVHKPLRPLQDAPQ